MTKMTEMTEIAPLTDLYAANLIGELTVRHPTAPPEAIDAACALMLLFDPARKRTDNPYIAMSQAAAGRTRYEEIRASLATYASKREEPKYPQRTQAEKDAAVAKEIMAQYTARHPDTTAEAARSYTKNVLRLAFDMDPTNVSFAVGAATQATFPNAPQEAVPAPAADLGDYAIEELAMRLHTITATGKTAAVHYIKDDRTRTARIERWRLPDGCELFTIKNQTLRETAPSATHAIRAIIGSHRLKTDQGHIVGIDPD